MKYAAFSLTTILLCICSTLVVGFSNEKRLIKNLLDNYKRVGQIGRPVKNASQVLTIQFDLGLIQILGIDEINQVLTINVWCRMTWVDQLLTWDPKEYNGVEEIRMPPDKIWTPDIVLYNYADERMHEQRNVMALINPAGLVAWTPPAIYKSTCGIDIKNFPFDQQACHLKFGSWTYGGDKLDIRFLGNQSEVNLADYTPSNEWEIIARPARRNIFMTKSIPYPDLVYFLFLRRNPAFFAYLLVLPCVLLSSLTLVIFWLPPESPAKMVLGMNIFVAFFLLLLLLANSTPSASTSVPYLGYYYCLNMLLITCSSFLAAIVTNLYLRSDNRTKMPSWLKQKVVRMSHILCLPVNDAGDTDIPIVYTRFLPNKKLNSNESRRRISSVTPSQNDPNRVRGGGGGGGESNSYLNIMETSNKYSGNSPAHKDVDNSTMTQQQQQQWNRCQLKETSLTANASSISPLTRTIQSGSAGNNNNNNNNNNNSTAATGGANAGAGGGGGGNQARCLENELREINNAIRHMISKLENKDKKAKKTKDWRQAALVLDRIFFWGYFVIILFAGFVLLMPKDPTTKMEDFIAEHSSP